MPGIDVRIQAGMTKAQCSVKATGTVIHPITAKEINSFSVTEDMLKAGVGKAFGQNPDRVALNDSYDCGFLYSDFGWKQVQTVLTVKSADVIEITSQPTIISTQPLVNKSKKTGTFNANISQQVENTTESNWSDTDTIEISQSFSYSAKFLGTGAEGETAMSYSHEFGRGGSESKAVTVSASQGVEVPLDPGESVVCRLSASRGVLKVRIVYSATLIGDVAVDYSDGYQDHHYWCFDIGTIRAALDIGNPLEFTEDIEVGFFANATVLLEDPEEPETKEDEKEAAPSKKEEKQEPPAPEKAVKLDCTGHACDTCRKCHDWQFSGSQETWDWVRNFNNWKDADLDRFCNEAVGKSFFKREGAPCTDAADRSGETDGSVRFLTYRFLIHVCLCDSNPVANSEQPASNPCEVQ